MAHGPGEEGPSGFSPEYQKTNRNNVSLGGRCFIVNIIQRIARKLRRIIMLHSGLRTFKIHVGKTSKVNIFMVVGPGGRVHDSQNQSDLPFGNTRILQRIQEQLPNHFAKSYLWKYTKFIVVFETVRSDNFDKLVLGFRIF